MKVNFNTVVTTMLMMGLAAASSSIVLSYKTEVKVKNNEKMIDRMYQEQRVMQSDVKEILRRLPQ